VKRTVLELGFPSAKSVDIQLISQPFSLGGIGLQFSSDTPRKCPQFPVAGQGRRRTSLDGKIKRFNGFPRDFGDFWTSLDLTGRLWSWDGWPPNSRSKRLFSREIDFLVSRGCPHLYPCKCWLLPDPIGQRFGSIGTRLRTAIYNGAGMCRLHLVTHRPHIHIHLLQCKLYGIIPYSFPVGAF
jgi:hypothetical protein